MWDGEVFIESKSENLPHSWCQRDKERKWIDWSPVKLEPWRRGDPVGAVVMEKSGHFKRFACRAEKYDRVPQFSPLWPSDLLTNSIDLHKAGQQESSEDDR